MHDPSSPSKTIPKPCTSLALERNDAAKACRHWGWGWVLMVVQNFGATTKLSDGINYTSTGRCSSTGKCSSRVTLVETNFYQDFKEFRGQEGKKQKKQVSRMEMETGSLPKYLFLL